MKKYQALYEKMKTEITSGALCYGAKLPSKRVLAEENGVSLITAETALDILRSEGYIESKERSGYFAVYSAEEFPDASFQSETDKTAYRKAESPFPSPDAPDTPDAQDAEEYAEYTPQPFPFYLYAKAVRKVLADKAERLLQKTPRCGATETRRALKNYLARRCGLQIDENQIVLGSGAEYLYGVVAELLGKDKIFGVEDPSYGQIERVYAAKNVTVRKHPLDSRGIRSSALVSTDANVLHVTPYRSYPSLITADASKKAEYLRHASRCDGYVVEDDYLSEFSLQAKPTETLFKADTEGRVIYVNTFSQTLFPSLRIAYLLLPPRLAAEYEKRLGFYSCPVPALEQYVLAEILNDGSFERHVNKVRRLLRRTKK